jgi:hypothetical protein
MTPVVGEDKVFLLQLPGKRDGRKLLAYAGMNGAIQLALGE